MGGRNDYGRAGRCNERSHMFSFFLYLVGIDLREKRNEKRIIHVIEKFLELRGISS